jgi:hypothetical protein
MSNQKDRTPKKDNSKSENSPNAKLDSQINPKPPEPPETFQGSRIAEFSGLNKDRLNL